MKFIVLTLVSMTKYKKTLAYLVVVLGLILLANATSANAASKGSTSFRVGTKPVERTIKTGIALDHYALVRVYVDGKQIESNDKEGCSLFFYRAWLTTELRSCESWDYIKVKTVNNGAKTNRVKVTWEDYGAEEDSDAKRRSHG